MIKMLFLFIFFYTSKSIDMFGLFGPIGQPSIDLPGPYSTLYAECRGINCNGEWKVSDGCTINTQANQSSLYFQCTQSGMRSVTLTGKDNTDILHFDFEVGIKHHDYTWYIVPGISLTQNPFCSNTSLCFSNPDQFEIRIWVTIQTHTKSFEMDPDEYSHLLSFPSNSSRLITKRFYTLGESPQLEINGQLFDSDTFNYNETGDFWYGKIDLNYQFPQPFLIHGSNIADYYSEVSNLTGYFYYVNSITLFDNLFGQIDGSITNDYSSVSFCGCFPHILAFKIGEETFITQSYFESFTRVQLNNDRKIISIDMNPHYVYAIDTSAFLYVSKDGGWEQAKGIEKVSRVRTSNLCAIAPTEDYKLSPDNDIFAACYQDVNIRVYLNYLGNNYKDINMSSYAKRIYDFQLNSYLLFAIFEPLSSEYQDKIGTVLIDLKQDNSSNIHYEEKIENPKLQTSPSGGFFIYGDSIFYTSDLFMMKKLTLTELDHDEQITNLISNENNFAFVTTKSRIFYGDMSDYSIQNLWSPSNSKSLNIFFKQEKLYSIYYDEELKEVVTNFIFAKSHQTYESMTYCLECPSYRDYMFIDLDQTITESFRIAVIHTEPLMTSVQSPSLVNVLNSYSFESYDCGQLMLLIEEANSNEVNSTTSSTVFEVDTQMSCSVFSLNLSITSTGVNTLDYSDAVSHTTGSGIVHVILEQKNSNLFTDKFQISSQCIPGTRLKLVVDDDECFSDNEDGYCAFNTLFGLHEFKPKIYIYDGDEERGELIEDFVMIPIPSMFNKSDDWVPDYEYDNTIDEAGCIKKPQSYSSMKNFIYGDSKSGWSKFNYKSCFFNDDDHPDDNPIFNFNKKNKYEILNSTNNCMYFTGSLSRMYFNLSVVGFKQTYCQFNVIVEVNVKNRALRWWEKFIPAYAAVVLLINAGIFIFWIEFKYSFAEFLYEMKRMSADDEISNKKMY